MHLTHFVQKMRASPRHVPYPPPGNGGPAWSAGLRKYGGRPATSAGGHVVSISGKATPNGLPREGQGPGPKGVLAGPGTPRDPKSHLFVTKWDAMAPFCTSEAGFDAKFRRGSRQIGPTPSNSTFFGPFLDQKCPKSSFWAKKNAPARNAAVPSNLGWKKHPLGAKKNAPARNAAVPSNLGWKKHPLGALGGPRGP